MLFTVLMRRKGDKSDRTYLLGTWNDLEIAKTNASSEEKINENYKSQIFESKLNEDKVAEIFSNCEEEIDTNGPVPIKRMKVLNL
jgi:hypothetical protein